LASAGCSPNTKSTPAPPGAEAGGPSFTGPWAAEFSELYSKATTDFERAVLEDGAITDQEFAEMSERFRSCLSAANIEFSGFESDGSFEAQTPDSLEGAAAHDKFSQCGKDAGEPGIGALHAWIARNPDNQDEGTIVVACLVREGLVNSDYSSEDWARDVATSPVPAFVPDDQQEKYNGCTADPLGIYGG